LAYYLALGLRLGKTIGLAAIELLAVANNTFMVARCAELVMNVI
jgi:hypothetical protein